MGTGLRGHAAAPNSLHPETCSQNSSARGCFPVVLPDALGEGPGEGPVGSSMQMLSGLMWAVQIQPSFAIKSSEVPKARVNYAPCSSYELTPAVLAAVMSWLLKIPRSRRTSRESAVRVRRRDGKMCWCMRGVPR